MIVRSKYIYPVSSLFVLCWWLLAFHRPVAYEASSPIVISNQQQPLYPSIETIDAANKFQIDRFALKKALNGDVATMGQLIAEWDLEAEIIEHRSQKSLKRLDRDDFLKAQLLVKTLVSKDNSTLDTLRDTHRSLLLVDDKGSPFDLSHPAEFFLPQTYLSAGILLALLEPANIVALPRGMREQTAIYPKKFTEQVPQDIDSFHMEQLYAYRPDVALISERYTHPLTLQALDSQGIPKYHLPEVTSIEDIEKLIRSLGHLCNRPLKAELMALFLKAGVMAIDNECRLTLHNRSTDKILILNYYSKFSLPGKNTLTHHMIDRIGINTSISLQNGVPEESWSVPVSEETIIHYNPKKLVIITASDPRFVTEYFYQTTLFQHIDAARNNHISILDDSIQQTVSQYILLAYHDLNRALVDFYEQ